MLPGKGQIVDSFSNDPDVGKALNNGQCEFLTTAVFPLLIEGAQSCVATVTAGGDPDLLDFIALNTISAINHLKEGPVATFNTTPVHIFELNYFRALGQFTQPTGPVVYTGSGGRGAEIYSSMGFPSIFTHPANQGEGKPIFGTMPPRVHSAEPNPVFNAEMFKRVARKLLPRFTIADSGNVLGDNTGLLLTNDSHQSLLDQYPNHSIEELVALRLDPDSLISSGRINLDSGDVAFTDRMVEAQRTLFKLLNKVSTNGHAIFTVGRGNADDIVQQQTRRCVLTGLRECLADNKIPFIEAYNPMAMLVNRFARIFEDRRTVLMDLLPSASVQALIIPYSRRISSLSDYSTDRMQDQLSKAAHFAELTTLWGTGMDEDDLERGHGLQENIIEP